MPGSTPSSEPAAGVPAEGEADLPVDTSADLPADTEAPPANRAERRAKKSGQPPTHTGPQSAEHTRRGKGPRSHTKRG